MLFAWPRLRAPTAEFWPIRAQIQGFRMYLDTAEEDRLEKLNPPEKTVALFERYLPYAMALDVENRWAKRFTGVLAAAAIDPTVDSDDSLRNRPFYTTSTGAMPDPGSLTEALGRSFSDKIASASTAPGSSGGGGSSSSSSSSGSSSSGSSGGGSSGGGGGGGGGSGW
jgi:hypothetical protein